jgi:hypothetical protein
MGNIVIINIHQPTSNIFYLFDKLLLLDEYGYAVYCGNPFSASGYFKKNLGFVDSVIDDGLKYGQYNPELLFELIEYKAKSDTGEFENQRIYESSKWYSFFKSTNQTKLNIEPRKLRKSNTHIPNLFTQLILFLKRNFMTRISDKQYMLLLVFGAPLLSLFMSFFLKSTDITTHKYSFMENENIPAYLFISVVVSMFLGLIISSSEIHLNALQIMLYVLVGNTILEIKGLYWSYTIILWITATSSSLLGLLISARLNTILAIYITIPFLLIPQILLAGTIIDFDKLHHSITSKKYVPFYADINISRWSYEGLMTLQFTQNKYDKDVLDELISQSEMIYLLNFVIPKLETQHTQYLKENHFKNEVSTLVFGITNHFPELSVLFKDFENLITNAEQFYITLKKAKKFIRIQLNKSYERIDNIRNQNKSVNKEDFFNQQLSDFVLNTRDYEKYVYLDGEMIRKFQPGYYISANTWARSHYYAPYKRLGSFTVKTWIFNSIVISIFGIIFYFITIYNLKRRKY